MTRLVKKVNICPQTEVWGYKNKACLCRLWQAVREGGHRLYSREFYSPGICAVTGCK